MYTASGMTRSAVPKDVRSASATARSLMVAVLAGAMRIENCTAGWPVTSVTSTQPRLGELLGVLLGDLLGVADAEAEPEVDGDCVPLADAVDDRLRERVELSLAPVVRVAVTVSAPVPVRVAVALSERERVDDAVRIGSTLPLTLTLAVWLTLAVALCAKDDEPLLLGLAV